MKHHIRIEPAMPQDVGSKHVVIADRIIYVDNEGNETDISSAFDAWKLETQHGNARKLTIRTMQLDIAPFTREPDLRWQRDAVLTG